MKTPEEFLEEVKRLSKEIGYDEEEFHCRTDDLMGNLLIDLGYRDGIELIRRHTRWYS